MNDPDATSVIRWVWTLSAGFGVLFAIFNLGEVLVDNWVIGQEQSATVERSRPVELLRLQTRSSVYDHGLILFALTADLLAGIFAIAGVPPGALISLVASAGALIALSFTQAQRRRKLFSALRLRPRREKARDPGV